MAAVNVCSSIIFMFLLSMKVHTMLTFLEEAFCLDHFSLQFNEMSCFLHFSDGDAKETRRRCSKSERKGH